MTETLGDYQSHVQLVQTKYVPHLENFCEESDCRDQAEAILDFTSSFAGFAFSNCGKRYDEVIK